MMFDSSSFQLIVGRSVGTNTHVVLWYHIPTIDHISVCLPLSYLPTYLPTGELERKRAAKWLKWCSMFTICPVDWPAHCPHRSWVSFPVSVNTMSCPLYTHIYIDRKTIRWNMAHSSGGLWKGIFFRGSRNF